MTLSLNVKDRIGKAKALYEEAIRLVEEGADPEAGQKAMGLMEEADKLRESVVQAGEVLTTAQEKMGEIDALAGRQVPGSKKFADLGEFTYAVWQSMNPRNTKGIDPRLVYFHEERAGGHDAKDMGGNVGEDGGYLIPQEQRTELMSISAEDAIVRPRAQIIRMTRRQVGIPVVDQTGTTANRPHWFGGLQFYWQEEASEATESDPKFKEVTLTAREMIGYTRAPNSLIDDAAISLGDFLSGPMGFAGGVAWMEDDAFINGSGAGQPLGVLNSPCLVSVARESKTGKVTFTDLARLRAAFLATGGKGVWVLSQGLMDEIITLNGPTGNPSYIWTPNAATGLPGTLLGLPVMWTEKTPAPGQPGDALLANFAFYLVGDRQATTIDSTQYDQWKYNKTSWRVVHRVDGQPWLSSPLTLKDGVTQISPFVRLSSKST
ncbi:MAG TPA: phage major capsid protein [Aggregatilinea sp.]|uniref:phage major capsid protein n=1 Tax=Aggregatilinea sp. TaxID=2806333 RepID=UPI002B9C5B42|nr:phage major capsid protein [Aggregatilinea sp.]HML23509.1 phage major capsid protein [Aggregatilinea sp.]